MVATTTVSPLIMSWATLTWAARIKSEHAALSPARLSQGLHQIIAGLGLLLRIANLGYGLETGFCSNRISRQALVLAVLAASTFAAVALCLGSSSSRESSKPAS